MRKFKVTDSEIFMMVNDPPTSLLHIQLLVEDSEVRLTEDQITEILQITERLLLPAPVAEGDSSSSSDQNQSLDNEDEEREEADPPAK